MRFIVDIEMKPEEEEDIRLFRKVFKSRTPKLYRFRGKNEWGEDARNPMFFIMESYGIFAITNSPLFKKIACYEEIDKDQVHSMKWSYTKDLIMTFNDRIVEVFHPNDLPFHFKLESGLWLITAPRIAWKIVDGQLEWLGLAAKEPKEEIKDG